MSYEFTQRMPSEGTCLVRSDTGGGYDWDVVEVWKRTSDGRLYMYAGVGCSCYGPYDGVRSWEDMEPVSHVSQVVAALRNQYRAGQPDASRIIQWASTVSEALNATA